MKSLKCQSVVTVGGLADQEVGLFGVHTDMTDEESDKICTSTE